MPTTIRDRVLRRQKPEPPRYPFLAELIDQQKLKAALKVLIHAARRTAQPLHHFLIIGPGGMGKAAFATAAARELGIQPQTLPAGAAEDPLLLLRAIVTLPLRSILIVEHMDRMPRKSLEMIADCVTSPAPRVMLLNSEYGRSSRWELPPFTLIGTAENFPDGLPDWGDHLLTFWVEPYQPRDLELMLQRSAAAAHCQLEHRAAESISMHARGTPERALDILCNMWRILSPSAGDTIHVELARNALERLGYG